MTGYHFGLLPNISHKRIGEGRAYRRTFTAILYKNVKDQNMVASLTGHAEGSRAFARYRDIDREMKNDLVKLLD